MKKKKKRDSFDLEQISTAIDEHFYKLDGHEPVRCTLAEYAQSMQDESMRVVAQTTAGDLQISTIFTGIDRNFGSGPLSLFEAVVFGLPDDMHPQWRFSTWDEAMDNHRRLVETVTERGASGLQEEIRKVTGTAD